LRKRNKVQFWEGEGGEEKKGGSLRCIPNDVQKGKKDSRGRMKGNRRKIRTD